MKLRDISDDGGFKRFLVQEETADVYIVVELPSDSPVLANLDLLNEGGQWKEDPDTKLFYRVDPAGSAAHQLRHAHIAGRKHINSKNKQVAWNVDGSRHDKKTFNSNFHGLEQAKELARSVLKIPPTTTLEQFVPGPELLLEGTIAKDPDIIYLRV